MKTKMIIVLFLLVIAGTIQAQERKTTREDNKGGGMGMNAGIESCMDQIAADKELRTEMMTRMMGYMKSDTTAMKEMCRTMMKDPEMHKMMMEMMDQGGMGSGMGKTEEHEDMHHVPDSVMMKHQ